MLHQSKRCLLNTATVLIKYSAIRAKHKYTSDNITSWLHGPIQVNVIHLFSTNTYDLQLQPVIVNTPFRHRALGQLSHSAFSQNLHTTHKNDTEDVAYLFLFQNPRCLDQHHNMPPFTGHHQLSAISSSPFISDTIDISIPLNLKHFQFK